MFPDYLDGARVLEYTNKGHFGFFTDYDEHDNPVVKEICYYAVAHYPDGTGSFYIFSCAENFEVLCDGSLYTLEQCKACQDLPEGTVWYKK